jgi:hypothetical protein
MTRLIVLGVFVSPKGLTNHSKRPSRVLKVVFHHLDRHVFGGTHYGDQFWRKSWTHVIHQAYHRDVVLLDCRCAFTKFHLSLESTI